MRVDKADTHSGGRFILDGFSIRAERRCQPAFQCTLESPILAAIRTGNYISLYLILLLVPYREATMMV
jgi:hypothetical protein